MYMFYKYKFIDFFSIFFTPIRRQNESNQPTNKKTMNKVSKFFFFIYFLYRSFLLLLKLWLWEFFSIKGDKKYFSVTFQSSFYFYINISLFFPSCFSWSFNFCSMLLSFCWGKGRKENKINVFNSCNNPVVLDISFIDFFTGKRFKGGLFLHPFKIM